MSYSSEQTRKRILECAEKEFLAKGFLKANLREIARAAKATTGALYNHFPSKEVLFDALVKQPADTLLDAFEKMHQQGEQVNHGNADNRMTSSHSATGTDWVLDYIYDNLPAFRLIFCRSEGTDYAGYMDKLVEIEEKTYHSMFALSAADKMPVDDFFLHVMAASGLRDIYEVVSHSLPKNEAKQFMEKVKRFRFAGWRELLGEYMN